MKRERWIGFVGSYSICLLLLGAAGCSNQQGSGKPTAEEFQAFRGDPSKMPASMKAKIAAQESAGIQKALQSRNQDTGKEKTTQ